MYLRCVCRMDFLVSLDLGCLWDWDGMVGLVRSKTSDDVLKLPTAYVFIKGSSPLPPRSMERSYGRSGCHVGGATLGLHLYPLFTDQDLETRVNKQSQFSALGLTPRFAWRCYGRLGPRALSSAQPKRPTSQSHHTPFPPHRG